MDTQMIFGNETELGIEMPEMGERLGQGYLNARANFLSSRLPINFRNGGYAYKDLDHPEVCIPETSNLRDAVVYEKATEQKCLEALNRGNLEKVTLYKNNIDGEGRTFGGHENYLTSLRPNNREQLVLFGVVEKIITGAGKFSGNAFEISQRASYIKQAISTETQNNRGILNIRPEKIELGKYRLHHISNDSNMCPHAILLKKGMMYGMLLLAQNGMLPDIPYDSNQAPEDIKALSRQTSDWIIQGASGKFCSGIEVLKFYQRAFREKIYGHESHLDYVIELMADTLNKLERIKNNPDALVGRLDWVTKRKLLELAVKDSEMSTPQFLESMSLEYHRIDDEGMFAWMQENGFIEEYISKEEIARARLEPPLTRAYLRGKLVSEFEEAIKDKGGTISIDWDMVSIDFHGNPLWNIHLKDPFRTYGEELENIRSVLNKYGLL